MVGQDGKPAAACSSSPLNFPSLPAPSAGCTVTAERRARVYRLCQRYGLLLVEDDPYFYLQYPGGPGAWLFAGLQSIS